MSGILDLLTGPMGQQIINGVSKQTNQPADKTSGLLSMALPVLMSAMSKNAQSPDGAQGLMGALSKHAGGGLLDNLGSFFEGGVEESVQQEGQGILGHLLGAKQPAVENALSQQSGMDVSSVSNILKVAAPLLMNMVGKQTQQAGVSDTNGLASLLGGLAGGASSNSGGSSILTSLLDADGDGSIIDDVAELAMGKKKGGIGGLLGGLFGGK